MKDNLDFFYDIAVSEGYSPDKTKEDFINLLNENDEAVSNLYKILNAEYGYQKDLNEFTSEVREQIIPNYSEPIEQKVEDPSKKKDEEAAQASGSESDQDLPIGASMEQRSGSATGMSQLDFGFDVDPIAKDLVVRNEELIKGNLSDPQFINKIKEEQAKIKVGDFYKFDVGPAKDFVSEPKRVYHTEQSVALERKRIRDKYVAEAVSNARGQIREELLNNYIPEDKKGDEDYLERLTDHMAKTYGLDADLDGDGRYNEKTMAEDFLRSLAGGSVNLVKGVGALFGGLGVSRITGMPVEASIGMVYEGIKGGIEEDIRAGQTQFSAASIIDEQKDWQGLYNVTRRTTNAFSESLPIVGGTMLVGAATGGSAVAPMVAVGVLTGTSASMDAYYSGKYRTEESGGLLESIGEGLVVGGGEALFGRVASGIFKEGLKTVPAATYRQMLKGYAKGYGTSFSEEALTEMATELSSITYEYSLGGEGAAESMMDAFKRVADAGIMGGGAGVGFRGAGQAIGYGVRKHSEYKAANSIAEGRGNPDLSALNESQDELENQIANESDPAKRRQLAKQLLSVYNRKGEVKKALVPFYQMLKYRHPEVMDAISEIDSEVARLVLEYESVVGIKAGDPVTKTDEQVESEKKSVKQLENQLEGLLNQREQLLSEHKNEPLELTKQERLSRNEDFVRDAVSDLNDEIALAEADADDLTDRVTSGISNPDDAQAAAERVADLKEKRDRVRKMIGEAEAARRQWTDAMEDAGAEGTDVDAIESLREEAAGALELLAMELGLDPEDVTESYAKTTPVEPVTEPEPTPEPVVEQTQEVEEQVDPEDAPIEGSEEVVTEEQQPAPEPTPEPAPAQDEPVRTSPLMEGEVHVKRNKDGTFGVREGDAGLTAEEASAINRLLSALGSIISPDTIISITDGYINGDKNLGGRYSGGKNRIDISVPAIRENARLEGDAGFITKDIVNTLVEEIVHSLQTEAIRQAPTEKVVSFARLMAEAVPIDTATATRIVAKVGTYIEKTLDRMGFKFPRKSDFTDSDGNFDQDAYDRAITKFSNDYGNLVNGDPADLMRIIDSLGSSQDPVEVIDKLISSMEGSNSKDMVDMIVDEMVAEIASFASQNPDTVQASTIEKIVRMVFGDKFADTLFKQSFDGVVDSEASARAYLSGLARAVQYGNSPIESAIRLSKDPNERSRRGVASSLGLARGQSPAKLPNNKSFTMTFTVPAIRNNEWSTGEGYTKSMTFSDKWHFVNWWRRATNDGRKPYGSFVAEVDGKRIPIDADVIKGWNLKPLPAAKDPSEEIKNMHSAVSKYISDLDKNDPDLKYKKFQKKGGQRGLALSSGIYGNLKTSILNKIAETIAGAPVENTREFFLKSKPASIMEATDRVLSELRDETPTMSVVRMSGGIGPTTLSNLLAKDLDLPKSAQRARAGLRGTTASELEVQSYINNQLSGINRKRNPEERRKVIAQQAVFEIELIDKLTEEKGIRIKDIFQDTKKSTDDYLSRVSKLLGNENIQTYDAIFNMISAITSNGIELGPNIKMAKAVFYQAIKNYNEQGVMFTETTLDSFLKKNNIKLQGPRAKYMKQQLLSMSELFSEGEGAEFFREDGTFDSKMFVEWASSPILQRGNGTVLRNMHKVMGQAKSIEAIKTVKLPNYALSLMGADVELPIPDLNVIDYFNVVSGFHARRAKETGFNPKDLLKLQNLYEKLHPNPDPKASTMTQVKYMLEARSFDSLNKEQRENASDIIRKDIDRLIERMFGVENTRKTNNAVYAGILNMLSDTKDILNQKLKEGEQPWRMQDVSQYIWLSARSSKVGDLELAGISLMTDYLDDSSTDIPSGSLAEVFEESDNQRSQRLLQEVGYAELENRFKTPQGEALKESMNLGAESIEAFESPNFQTVPPSKDGQTERSSARIVPEVSKKISNFEALSVEEVNSIQKGDAEVKSPKEISGIRVTQDPFHSGGFVDEDGRPILSATEIITQDGATYATGRIEYSEVKGKETGSYIDNPPIKELNKLQAYREQILGEVTESKEDLIEEYNSLPLESKEALKNSQAAEEIYRESVGLKIKGRIRETANRTAAAIPDARMEIIQNPENYISKQRLAPIKEKLRFMSQEDLVNLMTDDGLGRLSNRNDDIGVLAGAELVRRKIADGDVDGIPALIEELSKMGTSAGRILRHFRELKGSTPQGLAMVLEKAIQKRGNQLTNSQKERLNNLTAELYRLQAEQKSLMDRAIRGEDVEAELKEANRRLKEAERQMDTFTNMYVEKGWGQIGQMLIQGNLLTPMSQFTNVGANLINAMVKAPIDILAFPIERLANAFGLESPMKRNMSINAYMYGLRRFGTGFVEALDQIVTGQESGVTEWRMNRGFAPFRSIVAAYKGGDMLPLGPDGKASASQRAKLFVQGTLGVPAEVMFRFLSLGDTPFRRMVEGHELYQAGLAMGLEGEALKSFLKYPTRQQMERAAVEGRKLTFQEETVASRMAEDAVAFAEKLFSRGFDWMPYVDGKAFGKFFVRANVPYVRTPANILYDTLTFVTPYIAIPRMLSELNNNDTRGASQTLAKLLIGTAAAQTAAMLVKEGLLSGAIEWDEEEEKNIAYDQFPPNSINVSGLKRWINGGSPEKERDDFFIGYNKLGVLGAIFGAMAKSTQRDMSDAEIDPFSANKILRDAFGINAFSSIAHMMDQSFLQGMTNLVNVLSSSDVDDLEKTSERWMGSMFQAVSATVLPNTLSAINRMDRDYMPDMRITSDMPWEERILKKMEYTIKDRVLNTDGIPVRVNWKGEPIQQTPRGTNPYAYQIFDITKSRQGEADAVSNEIWNLYERTEELTKAVGTPYYAQKRKISVPSMSLRTNKEKVAFKKLGKKYKFMEDEEFSNGSVALTTDQINKLMEISGKQRYKDLEALINSRQYLKMTDKERIEAMNEIHDSYNSLKEYDGNSFKPHTIQALDFIEEQYLKTIADE